MSDINAITYGNVADVTKSDTDKDPAGPFAGLLVTAVGALKITADGGGVGTFAAVIVGQIIPIATQRVWSTGTSATVLGLSAPPFKKPFAAGT